MDSKIWSDLFHPDISIIEKIVRPLMVYFFLVIGLRLAGKRELAQLNPFDLIVLLTLSNTVQNAIIGNDNSVTGGLIGATTLLAVNYIVVRFLFKHEKLDRLVEGDSDVLIQVGQIRHDRLKKELITLSELESAAHKQGFGSLDEVDRAVLEPGGTFAFIGKKPSPEGARHAEVLERLDQLGEELAALRASRS
ncbi:MAG: YetF domain-containing protein [Acidobacteriota bacterium]